MPAYTYQPYQDRFGATIAELLQHQGDIRARQALTVGEAQARAAEQSGNAWGQAIGGIGQTIAAVPQQIQQAKQQQQQSAYQQAQIEAQRELARQRKVDTDQGIADRKAMDDLFAQPDGIEEVLARTPGHLRSKVLDDRKDLETYKRAQREDREKARQSQQNYFGRLAVSIRRNDYDPAWMLGALHDARQEYADDPAMLKQIDAWREQTITDPASMHQVVDAAIGQSSFADELKPKAPITHDPTKELLDPTTLDVVRPAQADPRQAEIARHNRAMEDISTMGADRAARTLAETARHNRAMEDAARNTKTSRPVLSGDANRIADIDTSIDDAQLLQTKLTGTGAPGIVSRIGASLPNVVSEVTGWGADAKSRQAVIDLAKQIIGKGLEGGVLRKEDEAKYARILPTIGDAPEVAQAKLESLVSVLGQKRARTIEALSDAGFNVSKYERTERKGETPPPPAIKPMTSHGAGNPRLPKF